jgi:hypothetical protein
VALKFTTSYIEDFISLFRYYKGLAERARHKNRAHRTRNAHIRGQYGSRPLANHTRIALAQRIRAAFHALTLLLLAFIQISRGTNCSPT